MVFRAFLEGSPDLSTSAGEAFAARDHVREAAARTRCVIGTLWSRSKGWQCRACNVHLGRRSSPRRGAWSRESRTLPSRAEWIVAPRSLVSSLRGLTCSRQRWGVYEAQGSDPGRFRWPIRLGGLAEGYSAALVVAMLGKGTGKSRPPVGDSPQRHIQSTLPSMSGMARTKLDLNWMLAILRASPVLHGPFMEPPPMYDFSPLSCQG